VVPSSIKQYRDSLGVSVKGFLTLVKKAVWVQVCGDSLGCRVEHKLRESGG
jgi:hypothetical protein